MVSSPEFLRVSSDHLGLNINKNAASTTSDLVLLMISTVSLYAQIVCPILSYSISSWNAQWKKKHQLAACSLGVPKHTKEPVAHRASLVDPNLCGKSWRMRKFYGESISPANKWSHKHTHFFFFGGGMSPLLGWFPKQHCKSRRTLQYMFFVMLAIVTIYRHNAGYLTYK